MGNKYLRQMVQFKTSSNGSPVSDSAFLSAITEHQARPKHGGSLKEKFKVEKQLSRVFDDFVQNGHALKTKPSEEESSSVPKLWEPENFPGAPDQEAMAKFITLKEAEYPSKERDVGKERAALTEELAYTYFNAVPQYLSLFTLLGSNFSTRTFALPQNFTLTGGRQRFYESMSTYLARRLDLEEAYIFESLSQASRQPEKAMFYCLSSLDAAPLELIREAVLIKLTNHELLKQWCSSSDDALEKLFNELGVKPEFAQRAAAKLSSELTGGREFKMDDWRRQELKSEFTSPYESAFLNLAVSFYCVEIDTLRRICCDRRQQKLLSRELNLFLVAGAYLAAMKVFELPHFTFLKNRWDDLRMFPCFEQFFYVLIRFIAGDLLFKECPECHTRHLVFIDNCPVFGLSFVCPRCVIDGRQQIRPERAKRPYRSLSEQILMNGDRLYLRDRKSGRKLTNWAVKSENNGSDLLQ